MVSKTETPHADAEIQKLLELFEHEYDVCTERLVITKPVFDGRIGDPSLKLKRSLTRFLKHHVKARESKLKATSYPWQHIQRHAVFWVPVVDLAADPTGNTVTYDECYILPKKWVVKWPVDYQRRNHE